MSARRCGFSYISNIIGMILFALVVALLLRAISAANGQTMQLRNAERLTNAMINMTEGLQLELEQGTDISDYPAIQLYSKEGDLKGTVQIRKEYVLSDTAVYLVSYKIALGNAQLNESVVLYSGKE